MFGIPEWAIGVGVVLTVVTVLRVVAVRLMPPGYRRRSLKDFMNADAEDAQGKAAELEDLKRRMGELEERLDFAERMLAQKRESDKLPR